MKQGGLQGKWQEGKNAVKLNLPVMFFEEDGIQIAYIPVLDISGYGKTEKEAKSSLEINLSEYFSYTIHKNTLIEDLKAHGWTIKKKTKPYIAPELTDILNRNEYLHNIVNSRPYKMDRMDVNMPQYAC
ncbi:MAG: hypothetical protein ABI666_04080 [Ferruginibacter sp.]